MANISVTGGTLVSDIPVQKERQKVVETISAVNENNVSVKRGTLAMKRVREMVDVIQGGIEAMNQPKTEPEPEKTPFDPDREFSQSFRTDVTPSPEAQTTQISGMAAPQAGQAAIPPQPISSPQFKTTESPSISRPEAEERPTIGQPPIQERPEVEVTELPDTTAASGVQPTDGGVTTPSFIDSFVDRMGVSEGTTDHTDQLGISTLGYGVLPETAERLGFNIRSSQYADRKVLAKAVYSAMYDEAVNAYPDVFDNLSDNQKAGVLSLYINAGTLYDGVVNALSQETPDFDAAKTSLASIVLNSPRDENEQRLTDKDGKIIFTSNKGLSRRRAQEYNLMMEGTEGFNPVTTVEVEGTREQPTFVWRDSNNNEVHRYTPSVTGNDKVYQGLDSGSTMDSVGV